MVERLIRIAIVGSRRELDALSIVQRTIVAWSRRWTPVGQPGVRGDSLFPLRTRSSPSFARHLGAELHGNIGRTASSSQGNPSLRQSTALPIRFPI